MKRLIVSILAVPLLLGSSAATIISEPEPRIKRYRSRWHKVQGRWYKFYHLPGRKRPLLQADKRVKTEQIESDKSATETATE